MERELYCNKKVLKNILSSILLDGQIIARGEIIGLDGVHPYHQFNLKIEDILFLHKNAKKKRIFYDNNIDYFATVEIFKNKQINLRYCLFDRSLSPSSIMKITDDELRENQKQMANILFEILC